VRLVDLDRAARGTPQLQVATHGRWELAETAPLPLTSGGVGGMVEALAGTEVAVEVLWPGPPIVFVGARASSIDRLPVREIAARRDRTPSQALRILADSRLGTAVRAELGAVNAWQSVGPLPVQIDADALALETALASRLDLACCDRPVALEIVHHGARQAWWAIEVSSREAGTHRVRVARVVQLLRSSREMHGTVAQVGRAEPPA
jgi:hypothetical protein